jgi:hypothetical protein
MDRSSLSGSTKRVLVAPTPGPLDRTITLFWSGITKHDSIESVGYLVSKLFSLALYCRFQNSKWMLLMILQRKHRRVLDNMLASLIVFLLHPSPYPIEQVTVQLLFN